MSGASLEISLSGLEGVGDKIQRLLAATADLTPLMDQIGESLLASSQQRFEDQQGPDGQNWAALAASTIKSRLRKGYWPGLKLIRTGGLRRSLTQHPFPDQVIISMGGAGDSKNYARIQQYGGRAGRKHKAVIPARPVLGLSAEDEKEIVILVDEYFEELLN